MESTPMLDAVAVRKRLLDSSVVANPKKSSLGVNDSISFASLFLRALSMQGNCRRVRAAAT